MLHHIPEEKGSMADAAIGGTIKVLLDRVISPATDRILMVFGFEKELEALQESARMVQAVLADAEAKQTENEMVRFWLEKVERVAFEADNVFSELNYEILGRNLKSMKQPKWAKVRLPFSSPKHDISLRWRMVSKINEVNKKLTSCNLKAMEIGLIIGTTLFPAASAFSCSTAEFTKKTRESNSLAPRFIAGRSREESEIVAILLGFSSESVVSVLPIVGMGGLGKTTLAKSIYNNTLINSHFSKKVWICVSEKFRVTELFRLILESLRDGGEVKMSSQEAIVQQIRTKLRGERFLLVLDDVWNDVSELWEEFFVSLVELSNTNGSCCLLTTRLRTTARIVSTHKPYFLKKLKDDECWSILTQKATKGGKMPNEMNVLKNQILRRCQGLPLAAKVIGGLLQLQEKEEWPSILENKILKFSGDHEGDNGIAQILKLSFNYLPFTSIKKCFAYLSIFPKDEEMRGDELVQLWMAEGFLNEASVVRETSLTMEEIGWNYLRILVQSSLLDESFDDWGPLYKMHNLVHDLAELVSKGKLNNGALMENSNPGRYRVLGSLEEGKEKVLINAQLVRTLFVNDDISNEMLLKFKNLRALNLSSAKIKNYLPSISKLKHLCYLDLSRSKIMVLPESLCKLYNLQTLRLQYDRQGLPRGMKSLIGLRHLDYYNSDEKFQMPQELGRLICLQTLQFFNVGEMKGCQIEELTYMTELRGKLVIRNLEFVKGKQGAELANLSKKRNLKRLEFIWGNSIDRLGTENGDEHVLEGLKPHPNLQELIIENFLGDQFPKWFEKLSALVTLKLSHCDNCTQLPALGNFPCLETLELTAMRGLTEWKAVAVDDDVVLFPNLKNLRINDCCQLSTTPNQFPSLHRLEIYGNVQAMVVNKILTSSVGSVLEYFSVYYMNGLTSLSDVVGLPHNNIVNANHLSSLKNLDIHSCPDLTDIPSETLEGCKSLDNFWAFNCPNLLSCPLDLLQTPSLSSIRFDDCPKLFTQNDHMPKGFSHLTNLRDLSIGPFSNDGSIELFDWSGLLSCSSTLRYLTLHGSHHQVHTQVLPDQLQSFTFLKSLHLMNYGYLESVPEWLGNLVSLQTLHLKKCPRIQHLPSLQAMQRLTNLRSLEFSNCPLIKETFDQDQSRLDSYWSKISCHLPNLQIFFDYTEVTK